MKYDLSALEIMHFLGYREPVGREVLEAYEARHQITLPETYRSFLEVAYRCPMLKTSDLWSTETPLCQYYDALRERIEDFSEDFEGWGDDPAAHEGDELYPMYQLSCLPEEKWGELVADFLEIGSDYAGGIVTFGIAPTDLSEKDPPIFWQHEANPCTVWHPDPDGERMSDFLLDVVLNALALTMYGTAEKALEDRGWEYTDLSLEEPFEECLQAAGIDLSQVKKYARGDYNERRLFCCCDEENEILYVGTVGAPEEEEEAVLYQISRG